MVSTEKIIVKYTYIVDIKNVKSSLQINTSSHHLLLGGGWGAEKRGLVWQPNVVNFVSIRSGYIELVI